MKIFFRLFSYFYFCCLLDTQLACQKFKLFYYNRQDRFILRQDNERTSTITCYSNVYSLLYNFVFASSTIFHHLQLLLSKISYHRYLAKHILRFLQCFFHLQPRTFPFFLTIIGIPHRENVSSFKTIHGSIHLPEQMILGLVNTTNEAGLLKQALTGPGTCGQTLSSRIITFSSLGQQAACILLTP